MHLGRLARAVSMVVRRKTNIASLLAIGWLAAGWLAVGCADEPAGPGGGVPRPRDAGGGQGRLDGGEQDCARADGGARTADGQLADAADGEGPARRDFREPCSSGNECLSGYCIDDGEGGKLCTRPCNDDCPVDWDCRQLIAEGPDTAFLCFPIRLLCKPCRSSEECGGGENQCLAIGNGTFCSRACPAEDCPRGYACRLPRAEEGEASVPQCLPESGWCTLCRDEDRDGLFGGAGCTEAADCDDNDPDVHRGATERCDGKDNDCDAVTDEEFDLAGDPRNCGSCDRVCSFPHGVPGCRQGECVLLGCVRGWHICDARPERGCEYECQPTHGGVEQCDGLDNDCDCFTDEDFDLQRDPHHCGRCGRVCPVASCAADGRGGFVAASESLCDEGRCTEQEHLPCGLYTCFLGGAEGNRCANSCDDDRRCVAAAHCAAGECMEDLPDGSPCLEDRQCASGHCANGFCCRLGDCCATDLDCPPELYALPPRCHMPSACQGSREDAVCGPESSCLSMLVDDDSACTEETVADECGLFVPLRCRGEQVQQDLPCPQRCAVDEECDPEAHCDGICLEDREDGEGCDEDSDCAGGRCANGFCCADGDCCADEEDCPPGYGSPPVCITPRTCQGSRRDALCSEEHSCFTLVVDDDSACDARLVADGCGLYADQYCRGLVAQWVPLCDEECADDGHCDAAAHCDESECVADLDDGADCDEDSDCASGHCGNGHCCRSGDCCSEAADCPAAYIAAPRCDVAAACQGSRRDAVCDGEHRCGTQRVDDDSACNEEVVADECGLYASVHCNGAVEQGEPPCPERCLLDEDCDPGAHCDGTCQADLPDGQPCDEPGDCTSGHCQNDFCCPEGDCCAVAASCPAGYAQAPVCEDVSTCQGHRHDATCLAHVCATGERIDDDRGCGADRTSDDCGPYPAVRCTGASQQEDPPCPRSCGRDADCDPEAHCDDGQCLDDQGAGQGCDEHSDCADGLLCVDGVCCTTRCDGLCQRCDLVGNGRCTNIPIGFDPNGECGAVSCDGYFWGWDVPSKRCHERLDAGTDSVACNNLGGCQGAAEVCPLQGRGAAVLTCHALCQQPRPGSCTGTTAGRCDDINPGTLTCGKGECRRTVPQCVSGSENACVPGSPAAESCNGKDDDCDDRTDEELGTTTCGLGICRHTVDNCVGGVPQVCNPLQGAQPSDPPDLSYTDSNCDGIDGELARSVFVSVNGSDAAGGLTPQTAKRTIQAAIQVAAARNPRFAVLISAGTYSESITMSPGVSLYGGYNASTWARDIANQATVIQGTGTRAIIADGITEVTRVQGITVRGTSYASSGTSSYAVWVANTTLDGRLIFERCTIQAGSGGRGSDGSAGGLGGSGSRGSNGVNNSGGSGGWSPCSASGGGGGSSWNCGSSGGASGSNGGDATAVGVGGSAGSSKCGGGCPDEGGAGGGGGTGSNGALGSQGPGGSGSAGTLDNGYWSGGAGGSGSRGKHGGGGGGGGAGGADVDDWYCGGGRSTGGGGGGGGGAGCGGAGGNGGGAGGASIAVLLHNSRVTLDGCQLQLGAGGAGGSGGAGGGGASGGSPGSRSDDEGGQGAIGGSGGAGGQGGGGGGGCGGAAYGIARQGASAGYTLANGTSFSGGASGSGGTGGAPNGLRGCNGTVENAHTF